MKWACTSVSSHKDFVSSDFLYVQRSPESRFQCHVLLSGNVIRIILIIDSQQLLFWK